VSYRRACALVALLAAGCGEEATVAVEGGNAERGREVLERFECGACHRIPGVRGPQSRVGPTLENFHRRPYVAGRFENSP
jgi:cytochrome c